MSETITCPSCHAEFEMTAALASRMKEQLQQQFDRERAQLREKAEKAVREELAVELADRDAALTAVREKLEAAQQQELSFRKKSREFEEAQRNWERQLAEQQESAEQEFQKRLLEERDKVRKEAEERARESLSVELKDRESELAAVKSKLQSAQQEELELRKQARELEEQKREMELNLARQLDQEREKIRLEALKQADEQHQLKEAEKEKLINDLRQQIGELKRKTEQGSQQLQGEVLELGLEELLRRQFPLDTIIPVPKGVHGGDVLQEVRDGAGQSSGAILWESKRTKNWSDSWLPKLRDDQRAAKAQLAILVSMELPKGTSLFTCMEGVWVTSYACAIGLAMALRSGLIETARAKLAQDGQQGKMELLYNYLTGPEFKNRVEGIVEAFVTMRDELEAEKRAMTRQWAKREKQLTRAITQASGMHGDLSGIIGQGIPHIASLALPGERTLFDDSAAGE